MASGKYKHLVIVADGPLAGIPFAALLQKSDGQRLIQRYPVSTSISLGTLLWADNGHKPTNSLLGIADTGSGHPEKFVYRTKSKGSSQHDARRGHEIATGRSNVGALSNSRKEIASIVDYVPGSVGLAGPLGHESEIKAQMPNFAFLYFAVHGLFDPTHALRSYLLLAEEGKQSKEDGRLEAREIASMSLSARLAILSACQSGRGQENAGDPLGFAWAFRAAGCPSIVCSLWRVDDEITKILMTTFFENLNAGKEKDIALQKAMLHIMKITKHNKPYWEPYWWAAFQVVGDTQPISFSAGR